MAKSKFNAPDFSNLKQYKTPFSYYKKGGLLKRKDGTYSQRGLWDNIRDNIGSGKTPTEEMLKQEAKIKAKSKFASGGLLKSIGGGSGALGIAGNALSAVDTLTEKGDPESEDYSNTGKKVGAAVGLAANFIPGVGPLLGGVIGGITTQVGGLIGGAIKDYGAINKRLDKQRKLEMDLASNANKQQTSDYINDKVKNFKGYGKQGIKIRTKFSLNPIGIK